MALRTSRPVGPPDVLEVSARPPAEMACGVDADASPSNTAGQDSAPSGHKPGRLFFVIPAQTISVYKDK